MNNKITIDVPVDNLTVKDSRTRKNKQDEQIYKLQQMATAAWIAVLVLLMFLLCALVVIKMDYNINTQLTGSIAEKSSEIRELKFLSKQKEECKCPERKPVVKTQIQMETKIVYRDKYIKSECAKPAASGWQHIPERRGTMIR